MGYLLAWADSKATEKPESGGIRGLPCLILCLSPSWGPGVTQVPACVW